MIKWGFIPGMEECFNIGKSINMIHHIYRVKDQNHAIISLDQEQVFDKIQHSSIVNSQNKV
jgi:hypothetical protein